MFQEHSLCFAQEQTSKTVLIFVSQPCSRQMSTFLLVLTHKITTAFITNKARNIWNEICDFPFWQVLKNKHVFMFLMQDKDLMLSITIEDRWFIDLWEWTNSFATKSWLVLLLNIKRTFSHVHDHLYDKKYHARTIWIVLQGPYSCVSDTSQLSIKIRIKLLWRIKVYVRPEWRTFSERYRRMMFLSSLLSSPRTAG
jgi:hypothetical protein